jgi:spore germination protein YaaH
MPSRRDFLKLLLAGATIATIPAIAIAYRNREQEETPTPVPVEVVPQMTMPAPLPTVRATGTPVALASPAPRATEVASPEAPGAITPAATPAVPRTQVDMQGRKQVFAWLRMLQVREVPTSEEHFTQYIDSIDVAMPLNGGVLMGDGDWLQEDYKISGPWQSNLGRQSARAGVVFMPGVGNDRDGILDVLDSPRRQEYAVERLLKLATDERVDAPWDGVYLDLEGAPYAYRSQMSGFLYRIARGVKGAGLLLGISVGGVTQQGTGTETEDDAVDLGVAGELGDYVDLRCYDYIGPPPRSIAPHWWIEACIEYALKKGVRPEQMTLGLASFSQYWRDSNERSSEQMTYDMAIRLVREAGSQVEWVERDDRGLVREEFARVGRGHLWMTSERTYRNGLDFVDRYGLLGNTMFTPGMGNDTQWREIEEWRARS